MKYKHLRKVLSMAVALSLVMHSVVYNRWGVKEVEASEFAIAPRAISDNSVGRLWYSTERIIMHRGDSALFELLILPASASPQVTVSIIDRWNNTAGTLNFNNGQLTGTINIPHGGGFIVGETRILIENISGANVIVAGLVTYTLSRKIHDARVIHCESFPSPGNLSTIYNNATNAIRNNFAIEFRAIQNPALNRNLNMRITTPPCPYGRTIRCDPSCGNNNQCVTLHHKSWHRIRNVGADPNNRIFTIRAVNYILCAFDPVGREHISGVGITELGIKDSAVSPLQIGTTNTMQHELSHNLGVNNHCTNTQLCVMKDVDIPALRDFQRIDRWCVDCRNAIWRGKFIV